MRMTMVAGVVLMGCGMPMGGIDGGVDDRPLRELRVLVRERVVTPAGLAVQDANRQVVWWQELFGRQESTQRDPDGAHVFRDVPEGPALIEVSNDSFVFTALERLETCSDDVFGTVGAGVQLDVTLTQPAAAGDSLRVTSAELGADQVLYDPDAGSATVQENLVSWRSRELLVGQVTLAHHVREDAGTFTRTIATGVLDAGVFLQTKTDLVTVVGAFTPLARSADQLIAWDDASLSPLGAVQYPVTLSAKSGGLRLASLQGRAGEQGLGALALPALQPDSYSVSGSVLVHQDAVSRTYRGFSWTLPWSTQPEMKLRFAPPQGVHFAADGWSLSWTAPEVAPDFYLVVLQNHGDVSLPVPMGTYLTDQTWLPFPPHQHLSGMTAQVFAITGSALSEVCTARPRLAATRARIPAPVVSWP